MSDLGEWGSGNVFADLERPDAVEQRAKAKLGGPAEPSTR